MEKMNQTEFEAYCNELDQKVEQMTEFEKKFIFWELLDWYRAKLKEENFGALESANDAFLYFKRNEYIKSLDEMHDALIFDLF